jgi:predicted glycosyltransferase
VTRKLDAAARSIWIDLDNAPHVPLFAPIIEHYRRSGTDVILTARDHAKTVELLELKGFAGTFHVIGRHPGKARSAKLAGTLSRAMELRSFAREQQRAEKRIAVAVSHGSRSMVLAARSLRIPVLTMYDYEYTETHIFNRFSTKVLVPAAIPDGVLDSIGLAEGKRLRYSGIKEELYVNGFVPEPGFRERMLARHRATDANILAVVRPPATTANYHSDESEVLLRCVLDHLASSDRAVTFLVPRTVEQHGELSALTGQMGLDSSRFIILDKAVDGLQLAYAADLLVSGGGTMNREAALIGTPVYSIFAGRQGSLDAAMEREGVLTFIRNSGDVRQIRLEPRPPRPFTPPPDAVERCVIEQINSFL